MHILFLSAYVVMILVIGLLSMKKVKGMGDFFLGNRAVHPWMSAFSYGTAYFSAVIFIGYAGKIGWGFGMSSLWIVLGNTLVGSFLAWHVLAKRTREMTTRLHASTMPEFIGLRYESKALKIASACIIFIFLIPYSASVYKGLSYLFEVTFGFSNLSALILMSILTALYLFLGGFVAATLTPWVGGIILVLVLSASMSTLASLVLASSSAIALDLIQGIFRPNIDKGKLMLIMRLLCVVFVVLSFTLAVLPNPVLSLAALSWGAISGCLLAPYLFGLFWERATKAGVWAGMLTALSIVFVGAIREGLSSPLIPQIGAAAIVLPLLVVPVVSLVTKAYTPEHLAHIFNKTIRMRENERKLADDLV